MWLATVGAKFHPEDVKPNVVVPYAETNGTSAILDAVKLNLANQGLVPRMVKMERTYSYDRLFRELWAKQQPFILVEHDIVPWPGALAQLWKCPEPWCGFHYYVNGELRSYLGCTKFDPASLGECPLPKDVVEWQTMDQTIEKELAKRSIPGHIHRPPVTHLNFFHARMTHSSALHPDFWTEYK